MKFTGRASQFDPPRWTAHEQRSSKPDKRGNFILENPNVIVGRHTAGDPRQKLLNGTKFGMKGVAMRCLAGINKGYFLVAGGLYLKFDEFGFRRKSHEVDLSSCALLDIFYDHENQSIIKIGWKIDR